MTETEYPDEIYKVLAEVISNYYAAIDWKKAGAKSAYDFTASRLVIGGHAKSVPAAFDLIARKSPLMARRSEYEPQGKRVEGNGSAFAYDPDQMVFLVANQREVLRRMREESQYLALAAAKLAKERKEQEKKVDKSLGEFL